MLGFVYTLLVTALLLRILITTPEIFVVESRSPIMTAELEIAKLPLVELSIFPTIQKEEPAAHDDVDDDDELVVDEIPVPCFDDDIGCNAGLFASAIKAKSWNQFKRLSRALSAKYDSTVSADTQQKLQNAGNAIKDTFQMAASVVRSRVAADKEDARTASTALNFLSVVANFTAAFRANPGAATTKPATPISTTKPPTVPSCYFKSSPTRRFSSDACKFLVSLYGSGKATSGSRPDRASAQFATPRTFDSTSDDDDSTGRTGNHRIGAKPRHSVDDFDQTESQNREESSEPEYESSYGPWWFVIPREEFVVGMAVCLLLALFRLYKVTGGCSNGESFECVNLNMAAGEAHGVVGEYDNMHTAAGHALGVFGESWQYFDTATYGGFWNIGNTCYMASALQMLASLDQSFIAALRTHLPPPEHSELWYAFLDLMHRLEAGETVTPDDFKEVIDGRSRLFLGYKQQDSHEFLTTLLQLIDADYKPKKDNNDDSPEPSLCESIVESPVDTTFTTSVRVRRTCVHCGHTKKCPTEIYWQFSIDGACTSIEDGLRDFFEPEPREVDCERFKCPGTKALQTMEIIKLPPALLVHIKRFIVAYTPDYSSTTSWKNESAVSFDDELTLQRGMGVLGEFLASDYSFTRSSSCGDGASTPALTTPKYNLRGVVNHVGETSDSGHYYADCKRRPYNDDQSPRQWTRFNDSSVSGISAKEAIGQSQQSAYMVVYELE